MERTKQLLADIRERDETFVFLNESHVGPDAAIDATLDVYDAELFTTVMMKFAAVPLEKSCALYNGAYCKTQW